MLAVRHFPQAPGRLAILGFSQVVSLDLDPSCKTCHWLPGLVCHLTPMNAPRLGTKEGEATCKKRQ